MEKILQKRKKILIIIVFFLISFIVFWYFYPKLIYKNDFEKYCRKELNGKYICNLSEIDVSEEVKVRNNIKQHCLLNSSVLLGKVEDNRGVTICWGSTEKPE